MAQGVIQRARAGHAHVAPRHPRRLHDRAVALQPGLFVSHHLGAVDAAGGSYMMTGGASGVWHGHEARVCSLHIRASHTVSHWWFAMQGSDATAAWHAASTWWCTHLLDAHAAGGRRRWRGLRHIPVIKCGKPAGSEDNMCVNEEQDSWTATISSFVAHASNLPEHLVQQQPGVQHATPYSSTPGLVGREALAGRALLGQLRRRSLV